MYNSILKVDQTLWGELNSLSFLVLTLINITLLKVDQTLWGELESESEDESESSEEEDEDEDGEGGVDTGLQTPVVDPGLLSTTPSGATSVGGK